MMTAATAIEAPDRKGGFWIRFAAYLVDVFFVGAVSYLPLVLFNIRWLTALGFALTIAYYLYFWSAAGGGQTLGMRIFGLRVVKTDGGELGLGGAALRYVGFILASIPALLGLIWVAFDREKQGWHDKIAKTYVIRTR